ncbi:hypothetical protein MDAP_000797 [Mitosporidium daphniae]
MHDLLLSAPVHDLLRNIAKSVFELRESIHYPHTDELPPLSALERMVVISIGQDRCPPKFGGLDALEKKILLLLYSYFLGAGEVLQKNLKKISDAPIFDGRSQESTGVFIALWQNSLQSIKKEATKKVQVAEEWHMPALELWYDLLFLQKTLTRLWQLIIEMASLQIVEENPDPGYRHIDQRLEHANHCYLVHVLLQLEKLWSNALSLTSAFPCGGNLFGDTGPGRASARWRGRYRRLLITLNLYEISGWIFVASSLDKPSSVSLASFPTLHELEQREASVLYVQRVCNQKKDPSVLEISETDRSLPQIDVDLMSVNRKLGLDIWFIGTAFGVDYRHIQ